MRHPSIIRATLFIAGTLLSASAFAQPPHHRTPPPEAVQACASKSSGATCSFTLHDRQVEGTCAAHEGEALACRRLSSVACSCG